MEATETKQLRDYATRTDMFRVDPRIIEIEPGHNPRNYDLPENRAHLDGLKKSIAVVGVQEPLEIRFDQGAGRIILVDGECRLRACMELIADGRDDIKTVPAIKVPGGNEKERLFHALLANTGKPLSAWESGAAFRRLLNFGETEEAIAERLGYTLRFVKQALELADAPEEVKKLLSEKALTPALAVHELRSKATGEAIESLREKAKAAKANGKGPARKTHEKPKLNVTSLVNIITKLLESVEDDIFNPDFKFVEVDRAAMVKLAKLVGIKDKAVN